MWLEEWGIWRGEKIIYFGGSTLHLITIPYYKHPSRLRFVRLDGRFCPPNFYAQDLECLNKKRMCLNDFLAIWQLEASRYHQNDVRGCADIFHYRRYPSEALLF